MALEKIQKANDIKELTEEELKELSPTGCSISYGRRSKRLAERY